MRRRITWTLLAVLAALWLTPLGAAAASPTLTLKAALDLAERYNPGLQLARYQVSATRTALTAAPANAEALAPAAAFYARVQLGLTIPEGAISSAATLRQAQISYEQAVAQYYSTRQKVRIGALQAYVEWQRAAALVAAQKGALDRALTQQSHVEAAYQSGSVAKYDLLQVQAQVTGQQAALAGAEALLRGARSGLEQAIGRKLSASLQPEPLVSSAAEVRLETDLEKLVQRALAKRPDLRDALLELASRRLQAGLAAGGTASVQIQAVATQYQLSVVKARAEVEQALLGAQASLEELKAREKALEPAREALRLAELRYEAGLATYLEVQSAFAATLQAEAARIQTAANVRMSLARLAQATGDL